ncbi:MAG: tetratricopeptide repeat protein [Spirochaetota bacterium]
MTYKPGSVIYFRGDIGDKIYVLKNGRIMLTSEDIETGEEIQERVGVGEFFGVKSAFGKYPREENAQVLAQSDVIIFSVAEFEQYAGANTRVVLKMLKVFSTQLRRIHTKVTNLLDQAEQVDPELGLFRIGEYYHRRRQYSQARYALDRYLTIYPNGRNAKQARELLSEVSSQDERYGGTTHAAGRDTSSDVSDLGKRYLKAVNLYGSGDYQAAFDLFRAVGQESGESGEYGLKSLYEAGRCLHALKRHDETIRHFTALLQKYPKMKQLPWALYYIGVSYQQKDERDRAASFLNKVLSMVGNDAELRKKASEALHALGSE